MNVPARATGSTWPLHAATSTRVLPAPFRALGLGLAIVLAQVAAVVAIALATGASTPADAYRALCRWDGALYVQIAANGYRGAAPTSPLDFDVSNVAFFPGYPVAGRWLSEATGLEPRVALVLAAQLAAWGFWVYWLLFFERLHAPWQTTLAATLVVALHPAAFFLVVAYSESLFLLGLLGFLFWGTAASRLRWPAAAAHGVVMTATRLGGLPVAFAPLAAQAVVELTPLWAAARHTSQRGAARLARLAAESRAGCQASWRKLLPLALLGGAASLGGLVFLAWCQWRFGAWDLYMQTQQAGWDVSPDWAWWARPVNYVCTASLWHPNVLWPDDLSRFCSTLTLAAFVAIAIAEMRLARRGESGWRVRLVFYLAALVLFWLHAVGVSSIVMKSMIRYCLGVHVLLLLAGVHWLSTTGVRWWTERRKVAWLSAALVLAALVQAALAWRFFSDQWAA